MPKMKEMRGRTAEISKAMGVNAHSAERTTAITEAYWRESTTLAQVVKGLKLSGKKAYLAYCFGRIVEKNRRGDFGVRR